MINAKIPLTLKCLLLIASIFGLSACNHEQESNDAPQQPPLSSLAMDFSVLDSDSGKSLNNNISSQAVDTVTRQNFTYAAVNVAVWNTLLKIGLAVPVAAFAESFKHPADLRSDNTWVWSYSVRIDGIIHTAELHAKVGEEDIVWNMYVTKPGHYLDFNWFSGVSARDRSHGSWLLYDNPDNATPVLDIQWSFDPESRTGQVTYTNVVPGGIDNGAYITYGNNSPLPYDAFYDVYNKRANELVEIEWNRTDYTGRVKNPEHFGDAEWHYWDELLRDVPTPDAAQ